MIEFIGTMIGMLIEFLALVFSGNRKND